DNPRHQVFARTRRPLDFFQRRRRHGRVTFGPHFSHAFDPRPLEGRIDLQRRNRRLLFDLKSIDSDNDLFSGFDRFLVVVSGALDLAPRVEASMAASIPPGASIFSMYSVARRSILLVRYSMVCWRNARRRCRIAFYRTGKRVNWDTVRRRHA